MHPAAREAAELRCSCSWAEFNNAGPICGRFSSRLTPTAHDTGTTTILLACARAQSGDIEGARELLADVKDLPEEDETVDLALLVAASLTGKLELAGRELTRLGPQAAENEASATRWPRFRYPGKATAVPTRPSCAPAALGREN